MINAINGEKYAKDANEHGLVSQNVNGDFKIYVASVGVLRLPLAFLGA